MKISDIVYKSYQEVEQMDRFDMKGMPKKAKWYLQLLSWILAFPETFSVKPTIIKKNMKNLKEPYIMLCNHNSFIDFKVATRAIFPKRSTYIVAVDGFINREGLMRNVGCFPKRKFVSDSIIVRQIKHSIEKEKVICQIYPEARYSLVGTTSPLPESLAKLIKITKYPVVTLISHGHHLRQPFWNLKKRQVKTKTDMTQILTKEQIKKLSVEEIHEIIVDAFNYDDYQYQLDNKISINTPDRAEGLHKPLFICPHCHSQHKMNSTGTKIWCEVCNETYEMNEYGQLHNKNKNIFSHIPDWFEWQREVVRKEVKDDQYNVKMDVIVESLPNKDGFYRLGDATLTHNKNGYVLEGDGYTIEKSVQSMFGVHIEYDYFTKGDCISFSTNDDTFYIYPKDQSYNVTKFHFATEELYKANKKT